MYCFFLLISIFKTTNTQKNNLETCNSRQETTEKTSAQHVESSNYEAMETSSDEDTEEEISEIRIEDAIPCSDKSFEKNIDEAATETTKAVSDNKPFEGCMAMEIDPDVNPETNVEISSLEEDIKCLNPLPFIKISNSNQPQKISSKNEVIRKFNQCISTLQEVQKKRLNNVIQLVKSKKISIDYNKGNNCTKEKQDEFASTIEFFSQKYFENNEEYENCTEELNKQKELYNKLNLENSRKNLDELNSLIIHNDKIYEKWHNEYNSLSRNKQ